MQDLKTQEATIEDNFTAIYRRYARAIAAFLRRYIYDREACNELCHDVFLKILEKNIRLDPESPRTASFLFTVSKNTAIDYLRRKKTEMEKLRSMRLEEAVLDRQFYESIENTWIRGEIISTLKDTINALPQRKRALFLARHYYNKSGASLARDSGTSVYHLRKLDEEIARGIRASLGRYFEDLT